MTRYAPGRRSHCPISFALDILGDRWTLLIFRDLLMNGKETYGELLASDEGMATNVLADRLAWLEHHRLIRRSGRVYRVTRKGLDLLPVMLEMVRWSARYDPHSAAPPALVKQIAADRARVLRTMTSAYREKEKTALVRAGLEALIAREAARRLAALGGTMPHLQPILRRRLPPHPIPAKPRKR